MTDKLFTDIYKKCAYELERIILQASQEAVKTLYNKLSSLDDWLGNDFSLAINLLESNHSWLAHKVSEVCLSLLKGEELNQTKIEGNGEKLLSGSIDDLSLVSKDAFEDWLIVNTAIKAIESELSQEIIASCQILGTLKGEIYDAESLPVGPHKLLSEVKRKIDSLELPPAPQTVIYKSFAGSLTHDLKELYGQIEVEAKRENLKYKSEPVHKQASLPPKARNHMPAPEAPVLFDDKVEDSQGSYDLSSDSNKGENGGHIQTLNTLSRLSASLSSGRSMGGIELQSQNNITPINAKADEYIDASKAGSESVAYAPAQLASTISQLQNLYGEAFVSQPGESLRSWVEGGLKSGKIEAAQIGLQASELIDVTDRFFDVVVDKVGVSGILEKWLQKLKLTILKIVLSDDSFFSDASHPARQMLNKLAKLASSENAGNARLEHMLDQYIDKVVNEYDENTGTVEDVVSKLNKLLERQEQAYRRNSERIARTYEGKERIADSRCKVVADLNDLLAGKPVPEVVMALLNKAGWREYLSLVLVRDGQQSEAYKEAINVIQQLLLWFDDSVSDKEKWALELEIEMEAPSLFEMVSKEPLVTSSTHGSQVLDELEACLFKGRSAVCNILDKYEWPFETAEIDLEQLQPVEKVSSSMTHWHKSILSMKIGDWIEIKDEKGKARSLRLAWSGSESFRFVFVDSQGMKDEDVSLNDLVDKFKDGQATFMTKDEVPLVDQGLHQMVQSVYEELSNQASCDVLTGLLNRQAFERAIDQSITEAIASRRDVVVFYADLDKFNLTNSTYGHVAGDAVLKNVANILRAECSEGAFCGRLGGNEFGMIMPGINVEQASRLAENIRSRVEGSPIVLENHTIKNTISIGIVQLDIELDDYDIVMRKAAMACDSSKDQGQNRCTVYTAQDKDQQKRNDMLQWVQYLDGNLDDLLVLRCQEIRPINKVQQGRSHWEVLLGVKKEGQVLPPVMLIEAAEHFGKMAKVDRWVFHNVLAWMEENANFVENSHGFSINLSGNSLSDETFLEFVLGELAAFTVAPEKICFEITETAAIASLASVTELIRVMKTKGCKFSLDDFGSGLSSYAYIQKLPVDYIKIDGVFVRNIVNNHNDQALVKSINELAHFMGIETVAEYVENHEILKVLEEIGVDNSQGYGIRKPGLLSELVS